MSNHIYYLDATNELGSFAILNELKIHLKNLSTSTPDLQSYQTLQSQQKNHFIYLEKKFQTSIKYFLPPSSASEPSVGYHHEPLYLDVRDSGDSWLRICLLPCDHIEIPANLYHKFSYANFSPHQISYSYQERGTQLKDHAIFRYSEEIDTLKPITMHQYRELICELCSHFYDSGWVTGTGGSISIRYGNRIFMTPSGVQKERILPDELYMLDIEGNMLSVPPQKTPGKYPKLSDCSPLFLHSYRLRNAGAVLHSHDITCVLVTAITTSNEFRISHQEMIKGIAGYGYHDELIVPIIENTAWESELADSLEQAIRSYPKAYAVLVRDHGIYVWGDNWEQAKRHGECLHYLFNVAIQKQNLNITPIYSHLAAAVEEESNGNGTAAGAAAMAADDDNGDRKRRRMGTNEMKNFSSASSSSDLIHKTCQICCQHATSQQQSSAGYAAAGGYKYLVFDIEGTTTPITFVKDVLFPFARSNVHSYLQQTWTENGTQEDLFNLFEQAREDLLNFTPKESLPAFLPQMIELFSSASAAASATTLSIPPNAPLLDLLVQYFYWCMDLDRKISALKVIQGKIWRHGYESQQLQSIVYQDVLSFFQRVKKLSPFVKLFIYSSGSMEAQKLLFQYSNCGDLRPYLSCYFDTTIGTKRQAKSYQHIYQSLGANNPSEILFVTDIIEEAYAAKEAGVDAILSSRPGNAHFPANPPFPIITSFEML